MYSSCLTQYASICCISVGIVNRKDDCCKFRMVGTDVEVLDADMSVVASKVVADEQGKHDTSLEPSWREEVFSPLFSTPRLRREKDS